MKTTRAEEGFTLIELLVTIAIVGVLASIGLPTYQSYRNRAKAAKVVTELKQFSSAFYVYYIDQNQFPADSNETIPLGMEGLLPPQFVQTTAIGGRYNWEGPDFYPYAGISITSNPDADLIVLVDSLFDDGSLLTGKFRQTPNGRPTFVIEE